MIKFRINHKKNSFTVIDKSDYEEKKVYPLSDIAFVSFEFFDEDEVDGFACIYLKSVIEEYNKRFESLIAQYPDLPDMDDEIDDHKNQMMKECFSYDNQIEMYQSAEFEFDIHELFIDLILICNKHHIEVLCPDPEN
jgi:hypothetical protein